jgi:hypothetical protein
LATKYVAGGEGIAILRVLLRTALQLAAAQNFDELAICVHPRHAGYYEKRLGFRVMGAARSCPWVCGRPAVAMSLNVGMSNRSPAWTVAAAGSSSHRFDNEPSSSRIDSLDYFRRLLVEASPFPLPDPLAAAA